MSLSSLDKVHTQSGKWKSGDSQSRPIITVSTTHWRKLYKAQTQDENLRNPLHWSHDHEKTKTKGTTFPHFVLHKWVNHTNNFFHKNLDIEWVKGEEANKDIDYALPNCYSDTPQLWWYFVWLSLRVFPFLCLHFLPLHWDRFLCLWIPVFILLYIKKFLHLCISAIHMNGFLCLVYLRMFVFVYLVLFSAALYW